MLGLIVPGFGRFAQRLGHRPQLGKGLLVERLVQRRERRDHFIADPGNTVSMAKWKAWPTAR